MSKLAKLKKFHTVMESLITKNNKSDIKTVLKTASKAILENIDEESEVDNSVVVNGEYQGTIENGTVVRPDWDTLEIGSAPSDEDCAQVGSPDYADKVKVELRAYINQLKRMFPDIPAGAKLFIKSNPHDFGTYYEVAVKYDQNNGHASHFAYNIEGNGPTNWDEQALAELGLSKSLNEAVIKEMNHSEYMDKLKDEKNYPDSALMHIKQDAKNAIDAFPENPNAGYYMDEIHYCNMELNRRKKLRGNTQMESTNNVRIPVNTEELDYILASKLAGEYHGGQSSALYSFASTGELHYPNQMYINELEEFEDDSFDNPEYIDEKYMLIEFFKAQPEAMTESGQFYKDENGESKPFTPSHPDFKRNQAYMKSVKGNQNTSAWDSIRKRGESIKNMLGEMEGTPAIVENTELTENTGLTVEKIQSIIDSNTDQVITFTDGKVMLDVDTANTLINVFNQLEDKNKEQFKQALGTKAQVNKLITFALQF